MSQFVCDLSSDTHHGHTIGYKGHDQIWSIWPYLGKMAILTIFGHDPYGQKYGHDWYPWKDHKQTNSLLKKSSDLDLWVKSFGQNN